MRINGKHYDYEPQSVTELLLNLKLDPKKVVVELNGEILTTEDFKQIVDSESELEIVQFVGGG